MNTAQVSIELILAGILALCAFALPFFGGPRIGDDLLQGNAWVGLLGAAYLIGVVFDKLSDAILGPFEKFKRLHTADEQMKEHPGYKGDPFPQNVLEFRLRRDNDGRLAWMDSLKSRIRTSRELAVLGLPATLGIILHQRLSAICAASGPCPSRWLYLFLAINVALIFLAARNAWKADLPRTDQLSIKPETRKEQLTRAKQATQVGMRMYYLLLINSGTGIIVSLLLLPQDWLKLAFGLGGAIVTLLGLWTWHQITGTYLKFVAREMPALRREKKLRE